MLVIKTYEEKQKELRLQEINTKIATVLNITIITLSLILLLIYTQLLPSTSNCVIMIFFNYIAEIMNLVTPNI